MWKKSKRCLTHCFNSRSRERSDYCATSAASIVIAVSTRAPAKGATCRLYSLPFLSFGFNSRSRERSDLSLENILLLYKGFNSRSRERSDSATTYLTLFLLRFQLALPRKERQQNLNRWAMRRAVSTRAPAKGATGTLANSARLQFVSTRAPAKGATHLSGNIAAHCVVSTRAPAKGATTSVYDKIS